MPTAYVNCIEDAGASAANTFKTWNNLEFSATSSTSLLDSAGSSTGWTITVQADGVGAGSSGMNQVGTGDAAWVDEAYISTTFHNPQEPGSPHIYDITGLDNSATYNIRVFGNRDATGAFRALIISPDGGTTTDTVAQAQNTTEVAELLGVSPTSGEIELTCTGDTVGYVNAIEIEEVSGADTTAPVLTSPTAGSLTTDGVTPSVSTDEGNGTLYWGIYADAASPTAAQVVAGTSAILSGSQAVSGTGSQAVSAQTGLDDATSYELFFVHDDAAANRSNLSTVGFTTSTDSTAPSLTSPTAGSVTSTSVAPTVTTDTAEGTAYARVYADGATPTASQVQSGTGVTPVASATNITVGASGALNFSAITGLTEGTAYELYFVHEDAATTPNLSAVSTVGFTTTAAARSVALTGANGYELRDETGAVIASLNGIIWEWYDDPDSTAGEPTDSGTFNTSAGGEATITITGSSLADGAFGTLWVRHPTDDEIRGNYYLPITVS